MGKKVFTTGFTETEKAMATSKKDTASHHNVNGRISLTVTRNPARDAKAKRELEAFARDVEKRDGGPAGAEWLADMLGLLFGETAPAT